MSKIILVTGATSGFGEAIAKKYTAEGWNVIITGRRKERLDTLTASLAEEHKAKVLPLHFDVRYFEECEAAINSLPEEWRAIDILLNNAGLAAGFATIDEGQLEHWEQMIDTNLKGLLYMTKACIPLLKKTKGHIINIGSTAGKEVYQNGNVYCATKHAVEAITKGSRIDLLPHSIRVSSISPGAAETEFSLVRFDGDAQKAKDAYNGYQPMSAEDIAETAWFVGTRPKNVCINDVVMTSTAQANSYYINREK